MGNALDKAIAWFSPETGLRRERARQRIEDIQNSGYGNYGANRTKKALKGWSAGGGSAVEDIHDNLQALRVRSRDLYMGVPVATGAIRTFRTNVVGSGLSPKPVIDHEAAGITEEQAEVLQKKIAREFSLWADSENCDAERMGSFYELQQLAFMNALFSGDCIAIPQMKHREGWPYETCVLLVEADRLCNPNDPLDLSKDSKIVGGVEVDKGGEVVAYHIAKHHPLSMREYNSPNDWVRVPAYGEKTGRRNVILLMIRERIGQRRGVPILAPVIEALKQLGRYTDAELDAAVVGGMITYWITQGEESEDRPFGEVGEPEEEKLYPEEKDEIKLSAGAIMDLAPGEKVEVPMPGRPNSNFDGFVTSICRQIGAALELPYELVMKQFTASYSASRGALLEAWKAFNERRDWMVEKFCQPIYEMWFAEAVALGRIDAPGFFLDPAIAKAYMRAEWYGPTQGQLDPTKEVQAAEARVKAGFSTRAKEAMELTGTDFYDNMRTAKRENELMKEAFGDEGETGRNNNQQ